MKPGFSSRPNNRLRLRARNNRMLMFLVVALGSAGAAWGQQTIFCQDGFGPAIDQPVPLASLKSTINPVLPGGLLRDDLGYYIRNKDAAIQLGKALYWEMQAGSDGKVACATCHFHAGADRRSKNQLNPGANRIFNVHGPNANLQIADYPFTDPLAGTDADDVTGSQGIRKSRFLGISITGNESTSVVADYTFSVMGKNVRQVTGMNTPSTINAVFNHRNFRDGRAQTQFNGVSPFGDRDVSARVWVLGYLGTPVPLDIHIQNASLASQAVGPPLNNVEMSAIGRTLRDIGRKLLRLKPLGLQQVSPTDSVLGGLADTAAGKGLNVSYSTLIQQAFQPRWWNSQKKVKIGTQYYTMMEANFSLYWGLAIMLYESTLVSDDTPIDRYLDSGRTDPSALDEVVARLNDEGVNVTRDNILNGLALFETPLPDGGAGCIACHGSAELTLATVSNVKGENPLDDDLKKLGFDLRMERMFTEFPAVPPETIGVTYYPSTYKVTATLANGSKVSAPLAVYDVGFYNIGVRSTTEGLGVGGIDPFGIPLSFTRFFQQSGASTMIKVPGDVLACAATGVVAADLSGPLLATERAAVDGAFKAPGLRNAELSGPYFHNGGKATLRQVLEFYDGGGDFPGNRDIAPTIVSLNLTDEDMRDLTAFLIALTDERVRWQRAPFDHPQLGIASGQNYNGWDIFEWLPAVGADGADVPLDRFLNMNPFQP